MVMTTTCDHHKERGLNCPFWDSFHNRLELICSMPVWDNPLREYPLWDERGLWHTVTTFFQKQRLTSQGIVDPIVTFPEAPMAGMAGASPATTIHGQRPCMGYQYRDPLWVRTS